VAWAWAIVYPLAFAVLLGRFRSPLLPRPARQLPARLRRRPSCAAPAPAVARSMVHEVVPAMPLIRLLAVAAVIVAIYAALLARIEHITPRSILRAVAASRR